MDVQRTALRVDRSQVLRTARRMVRRLASGRGGAVLVVGEAGIGKTWLLAEASRWAARQGVLVVRSTALPVAEPLPYDLVAEMLRGLQRADRLRQARMPRGPEAFQVLTRHLGLAIADGPVLLVADDLHWSDAASLDLLRYAVARMADLPLGWLLAARPGNAAALLGHDLVRDGLCARIELEPFTVGELEKLFRGHLTAVPDPSSAAALLHHRTGGNPFLAMEVIGSALAADQPDTDGPELVTRTPDSVGWWLAGRLANQPAETADVLAWAALLPEPIREDQLQAVCPAQPELMAVALQQLCAEQLLDPGQGGWRFRHVLIRDAVLERLTPADRARRSAAAAAALAGEPATVLAPLLAAAGLLADAAAAYLTLGDEALRRSGGRDADQFYRQALDLARQAAAANMEQDALAGRVLALLRSGEPESARRLADDLIGRMRRAMPGDSRLLVFLSRYALALEDYVSDLDGAVAAVTAVADLIPAASGRPLAEGLLARAFVLTMAGQATEGLAHAERAVALARQLGDQELEARALNRLGLAVGEARSASEGMTLLESARGLAEAAGLDSEVALACLNLSHLAGACGDPAAMRDWALRGLQVPGAGAVESLLRGNAGDAWMDLGDLDKALAYHLAARSVAASAGQLAEARAVLGQCHVLALRGDRAEARRLLNAVSFRTGSFEHQRKIEVQAIVDEEEGCLTEAMAGYRIGSAWQGYPHTAWCLAGLVRTAASLGQVPTARRAAKQLQAIAASWPAAGWMAVAARGWLAVADGDAGTAASWLLAAADRSPEAFDASRLRLAAGLASRDRAQVAAACATLEGMGALAAAERGRADARAAGLRLAGPRQRRQHGPLTGREQQIAMAVASGKTNAEIGAELYLSARTVEHHVTSICTKLGFRSRVQIAAQIAAGQLPGSPPAARRPPDPDTACRTVTC